MVLDVLKRVYVNNRIYIIQINLIVLGILNVVFAVHNQYILFVGSILLSCVLAYKRINSLGNLFGHVTFFIPMFFVVFGLIDKFITSWTWGVSMYPSGGLMTAVLPYMFLSFIIMFITIKVLSIPFINKAADKIKESYDEVKKERDLK